MIKHVFRQVARRLPTFDICWHSSLPISLSRLVHHRDNSVIAVGIAFLVVAPSSSCFANHQELRIKEYSIEVASTPGSIHWVDDQRLAFIAFDPAVKKLSEAGPKRATKLAILDLHTNGLQLRDEFPGQLCVDGEVIAYSTTVDNGGAPQTQRFWISQGTVQAITKREVTREFLDTATKGFDFQYSCKPIAAAPQLAALQKGKLIKRLRPEHGVVEIEGSSGDGPTREFPIRMYRATDPRTAVSISELRGEDVDPIWPYFRFNGAYWLTRWLRHYPPAPPGVFKSWWLYPDGKIASAIEFDLRATFDGEQSWIPQIPIKDGFLAIAERYRRIPIFGNIGKAGLYRFDISGKHQKLMAGTVRSWAVSPDGCKVAVGNDDRADDEGSPRLLLKVTYVCLRK